VPDGRSGYWDSKVHPVSSLLSGGLCFDGETCTQQVSRLAWYIEKK
jgi:hypothetical protein